MSAAHALGHAAGAVVQHTVHAADRGAGCAGLAADLAVDLALQKAPGHSVALLHRAQLGHGTQVVKKADALIQAVQSQDRLIQGGVTFILLHSVKAHSGAPTSFFVKFAFVRSWHLLIF